VDDEDVDRQAHHGVKHAPTVAFLGVAVHHLRPHVAVLLYGARMPAARTDLELALELADTADRLTMERFQALDLVVDTKPDLTPVSDADRGVEQLLRDALAAARPRDDVLGEEYGGAVAQAGGRGWIIDPIDGTKNFVRGVPVWATLIALVVDGDVRVGVVSAPALGRRWWAERGAGAFVSVAGGPAQRLRVSAVSRIDDASLSFSDEVGWGGRASAFENLRRRVWRTRAYGDFWSHLLVAEGAVDIAIEPELSPWDIAALVPVIEEAGGRISGFDGEQPLDAGCAVTSNGALHDELLAGLRSAG
jgi:histidinol-phosphatase